MSWVPGLADGLRRDDADRLADVHELAGGHRAAVADGADARGRRAGERAAHLDRPDARLDQRVQRRVAEVLAAPDDDLAVRSDDVLARRAGVDARADVAVRDEAAVGRLLGDRHRDRALGAAVDLADDDVLRHVHQTPGEVARVGRAQRRVRQALAGAVRGDEVLQHREALAEVRLDRPRDVLALRVGDEALHARQLPDLGHVARRAGLHDRRDRVVGREVGLHGLRDLFRGLRPDLDELVVALLVGERATQVAPVDLLGPDLVAVEDLLLVRRHDDVGDGQRDPGARGPVEARVLQPVEALRDLGHRVPLGQVVDDRGLALLGQRLVDERVVRRQQLVEQHPAQRGFRDPRLARRPAVGGEAGVEGRGRHEVR